MLRHVLQRARAAGLSRPGALRRQASTSAAEGSKSGLASPLMLVLPAIAAGLGTWQIYRKQWKEGLIEELNARLYQAPQDLPADPAAAAALIYNRVAVTGRFQHDKEILIVPKTPTRETFEETGGPPEIGAQVITPFTRSDTRQTILVNRGWIPKELQDPRARPEGQVEGEQTIQAIIRQSQQSSAFLGPSSNEPEKNRWMFVDVDTIAAHVGADPILVDLTKESTPKGGWPLGGQTVVNIRNEHLQYILTWYTLAAATLAMWVVQRRKPSSAAGPRVRMPPPLPSQRRAQPPPR